LKLNVTSGPVLIFLPTLCRGRWKPKIAMLKQLHMSHHMQVDVSTLYSLQVLSQDDNPGAPSCAHVELEPLVFLSFADPLTYLSTPAMLSGGSKEGLSLLSILDNTQSPLGRKLLRTWILRPLVKETDIAVRTEGVARLAKVLSLPVSSCDCLFLCAALLFSSSHSLLRTLFW